MRVEASQLVVRHISDQYIGHDAPPDIKRYHDLAVGWRTVGTDFAPRVVAEWPRMQPFTGQSGADPGDVNFSSFLIKLVAAAWTELSYDPDQILASLTSY